MDEVVSFILELDADIRDPERILVKNTDFAHSQRYCPRLGELMVLEEKKAEERQRRIAEVETELSSFASFIRMVDYSILEALVSKCLKSWRAAGESIASELASVFEIDVSFDEAGEVVFSPSFEELMSVVTPVLRGSVKTLDSLPRLLTSPAVRPHLRESITNLNELFELGPSFRRFFQTISEFTEIEAHITEVLTKAFAQAKINTQQYLEFYPIYLDGKNWEPKAYLRPGAGSPTYLPSRIVYDPATELILDFRVIREDVAKFVRNQQALAKLRICTVSGALYIDARHLRSILAAIPMRLLSDTRTMLQHLIAQKVSTLDSVFQLAEKRLKSQPRTLDAYVVAHRRK
jgi:hypothetical protein